MKWNSFGKLKLLTGLFLLLFPVLLGLVWGNTASSVLAEETVAGDTAVWTYLLPGLADASDPVIADVDGNGQLDIVVGTHTGHVVVVKANGTLLWDRDISSYYGLGSNQQRILTAPIVADLNGDGSMEVIVGTGTPGMGECYPGSVIVLDSNGRKFAGNWPFMTRDGDVPPVNCPDGVYGTPAVADMDGDGDMEIAFGAFDKGLYVLNHNGTAVSGFPIDSALTFRFPSWTILQDRLADTIWSSPAMADLDGDGDLELIVGTDEGHFGERFGGERIGWFCPYSNVDTAQYCGGSLYAVHHNNQLYTWPDDGDPAGPNYPKYHWEHIQSTPAIADLNNDGSLDIIHGLGTYYQNKNTTFTYANRVIARSGATGKLLPGWNDFPGEAEWGQGKATGGATPGSPAIGDITGDGQVDVLILAMDKKLYAWHGNGQPVAGFPMTPRDAYGLAQNFDVGSTPILADYDGDGVMEVLFVQNTSVTVVDGDGTQLTPSSVPHPFNTVDAMQGSKEGARMSSTSPAVADLDNDGRLEVVVATGLTSLDPSEGKVQGRIVVWKLPNSSTEADWPMYKQNATRTSALTNLPGVPVITPNNIYALQEISDDSAVMASIFVENAGPTALNWQLSNVPTAVTPSAMQGTVNPGQKVVVSLSINPAGLGGGETNLGSIRVTATDPETSELLANPTDIPVVIKRVEKLWRNYLPVVTR